jgi:hypothetical protein
LLELRSAALETCQVVEEGEAQAGSSLASHLRALAGTSPGAFAGLYTSASRRLS